MTKWISVDVRLPKNDEQVLAIVSSHRTKYYSMYDKRFRMVYQCIFDKKIGWRLPVTDLVEPIVTHWMPLPQLPNE